MNILIVDDSRVMRQLVRRTLRHAGYAFDRVEEAGDGIEALAVLERYRPDLVLSDWNMPNMSGFELLQAMPGKGISVPFGFVTSESTPEMRAKATAAGARFLLTKPFTPENVRMALGQAGFKPTGSLNGSDPRKIQFGKGSTVMNEETLGKLISHLANREVTLTPGPKLVRSAVPCLTARWVDDHGKLLYAGFCDLSLGASLGAALGMRPPSSVTAMMKARGIPDELKADTREVFNVISRVFNDAGSVHTVLEEVYFPPTRPPIDVIKLDRRPASRRDYAVEVDGFGNGKLAIVSCVPSFIAEAVTSE